MSYESWISYRYRKSKQGRFLKFLNFISVAGIATGVMALLVVIAIMTGFGNNLREQIIGSTPHISIEKENGIKNYDDLKSQLMQVEGVVGASAYAQGNIYLESGDQARPLFLRGIQPETEVQVTKVQEYLDEGSLSDLSKGKVSIGSELARFYGLEIGSLLTLISPGTGIKGEGWKHTLEIVGIFTTGRADFDANIIITNIETAQMLLNYPDDRVDGIGLKTVDPETAADLKKVIYQKFGFKYLVRTWIDTNKGLFTALKLEKLGLFIILSLIILVASFNIISTLIVTVTSKVHDIGVLKAIGVPRGAIRRIFTKQGVGMGVRGILWGLMLGLGICYYLKTYFEVPADVYGIDRVPVDVQLRDMAYIVIAALVISFLATIYPASKAASLEPVDALRYE